MSDDLVARLTGEVPFDSVNGVVDEIAVKQTFADSHDRIESLQSEVARLQESEAAWKQSAQAAGEAAKMDDVGTLLRERNALQSELAAANARIIALMDLMLKDEAELATVKAENEKLRRDAERYRWLAADGDRAQALLTRLSGHEVEHAIDAALGSQPEGSQVAPGADEDDGPLCKNCGDLGVKREGFSIVPCPVCRVFALQSEQPKEGG
jgi:hypothetical protein